MKTNVRYYTQGAVLIALCIVIRRFITPQGVWGLNLGGLPIIIGGFTLGPAGGALVGRISDIVGALMVPSRHGGYTFLLTITAALTGAIPPGVLMLFKPEERMRWWAIGASIGVGQLITKVWLVPCFMNLVWGTSITKYAQLGLLEQLWHIPLYTLLIIPILKAWRSTQRA